MRRGETVLDEVDRQIGTADGHRRARDRRTSMIGPVNVGAVLQQDSYVLVTALFGGYFEGRLIPRTDQIGVAVIPGSCDYHRLRRTWRKRVYGHRGNSDWRRP